MDAIWRPGLSKKTRNITGWGEHKGTQYNLAALTEGGNGLRKAESEADHPYMLVKPNGIMPSISQATG